MKMFGKSEALIVLLLLVVDVASIGACRSELYECSEEYTCCSGYTCVYDKRREFTCFSSEKVDSECPIPKECSTDQDCCQYQYCDTAGMECVWGPKPSRTCHEGQGCKDRSHCCTSETCLPTRTGGHTCASIQQVELDCSPNECTTHDDCCENDYCAPSRCSRLTVEASKAIFKAYLATLNLTNVG